MIPAPKCATKRTFGRNQKSYAGVNCTQEEHVPDLAKSWSDCVLNSAGQVHAMCEDRRPYQANAGVRTSVQSGSEHSERDVDDKGWCQQAHLLDNPPPLPTPDSETAADARRLMASTAHDMSIANATKPVLPNTCGKQVRCCHDWRCTQRACSLCYHPVDMHAPHELLRYERASKHSEYHPILTDSGVQTIRGQICTLCREINFVLSQ